MRMMSRRRRVAVLAERGRRAKRQSSMMYRGLINIDYTDQDRQEYKRLFSALTQLGWLHLETSAFCIEAKIDTVLAAFEIVARQCRDAGVLSALTLHIQGSPNLQGTPYSAAKRYPKALAEIRQKPLP